MQNINTKSYWDRRFLEDWQVRGGEDQSRFFSRIALESLPVWLSMYLKKNDTSFCDWGCAFGDGTNTLKQQLLLANIVGVDISSNAIETAKSKYPDINFRAANFITEPPEQIFDVVFTSNTLEHFEDPWTVSKVLSGITKKHLIILVPFDEQGVLEQEHYYSFNLKNIPRSIGNNLSLSFYKITDTSKITPSYWNGKQILLVYSSNDALNDLNLTISDIDGIGESNSKEKEVLLENYKNHIKSLDGLLESHKQITKTSTTNSIEQSSTLQSILKDTSKSIATLNNLISLTSDQQLKLVHNIISSTAHSDEINELQKQVGNRELEIQKIKEQLDRNLKELEDARNDLSTIKTELEENKATTDSIRIQNDELTRLNSKLNSLLVQKNDQISNLENSYNLAKAKVTNHSLEIGQLKAEQITNANKITELEKKLLSKQTELNDVYDKYGILSSRFYELLNSKSWKLTKYLRLPVYLLKKKAGLLKHDVDLTVPHLALTSNEIIPTSNRITVLPGSPTDVVSENLNHNTSGPIEIQKSVSEKTNIVLLVQEFVEGGLERVVLDLAIRLKKQNFNTSILVAGNSGGWLSKEAAQDRIPVVAFENKIAELSAYLGTTKVDTLLLNHCYFGLDEFSKRNVRAIEIIHNVYFWQKNNSALQNLRNKSIAKYIAVSKNVFDYSVKYLKISPEKIQLINNGLNTKGFYRPHPQILEKLRTKENNDFVFIHLAAIRPSKCHITVLSAFKLLKSKYPFIKLWFAGNVDDPKLFSLLNDYIRTENLSDDIKYLGTLNRKQLSEHLIKADAALLPSSYEGFSIASLEYMFFGLPQILTNVGASHDIIVNSDIGIIVDEPIRSESLSNETIDINGRTPSRESIEKLETAMEDMINNKEVWKNKGFTAMQKVEQFLFDKVLEKYISSINNGVLKD